MVDQLSMTNDRWGVSEEIKLETGAPRGPAGKSAGMLIHLLQWSLELRHLCRAHRWGTVSTGILETRDIQG